MSLFARNLAKYGQDVIIENRTEKIISGKPTIVFSAPLPVRAIIKTVSGVKVFDGTNTEQIVTHRMCIAYRADVAAEQWVRRDGSTKRLRILSTENKCEKDEVLVLYCTERGEDSQVVNQG